MSLVSHWDMSTINPPDLGFRQLGNDGTGVGLVTATDIVNGVGGGMATEYNGINQYTVVQAAADMEGVAIALWAKRNDPSVAMYIYDDRASTGGTAYALMGAGSNTVGVNAGTVYIDSLPGTILTPYIWHFLVVTGIDIVGDDLSIAVYNPRNTARWNGALDEIMIFDAPFTRLQVTDLRNRTRIGAL